MVPGLIWLIPLPHYSESALTATEEKMSVGYDIGNDADARVTVHSRRPTTGEITTSSATM